METKKINWKKIRDWTIRTYVRIVILLFIFAFGLALPDLIEGGVVTLKGVNISSLNISDLN